MARMLESESNVAVTSTCTLSSVRKLGGVYWPVSEMAPGPLVASPPATDQFTGAAPPPESVALNCSTALPFASTELQPVQLVSITASIARKSPEADPSVTENVELEELPTPILCPQPERTPKAGTSKIAQTRSSTLRWCSVRARGRYLSVPICMACSKSFPCFQLWVVNRMAEVSGKPVDWSRQAFCGPFCLGKGSFCRGDTGQPCFESGLQKIPSQFQMLAQARVESICIRAKRALLFFVALNRTSGDTWSGESRAELFIIACDLYGAD